MFGRVCTNERLRRHGSGEIFEFPFMTRELRNFLESSAAGPFVAWGYSSPVGCNFDKQENITQHDDRIPLAYRFITNGIYRVSSSIE